MFHSFFMALVHERFFFDAYKCNKCSGNSFVCRKLFFIGLSNMCRCQPENSAGKVFVIVLLYTEHFLKSARCPTYAQNVHDIVLLSELQRPPTNVNQAPSFDSFTPQY